MCLYLKYFIENIYKKKYNVYERKKERRRKKTILTRKTFITIKFCFVCEVSFFILLQTTPKTHTDIIGSLAQTSSSVCVKCRAAYYLLHTKISFHGFVCISLFLNCVYVFIILLYFITKYLP